MPSAVELAKSGRLMPEKPAPAPSEPVGAPEFSGWTFDIFTVAHDSLSALAYNALVSAPELSAAPCKVDQPKLWRYVCEVTERYHSARPFHSFRHGCDVLLATSALVQLVRASHAEFGADDPLLIAALLVAALVHDTNHPGCMNGYLVATEHALAADDKTAVLERHHAAMALALLDRPDLDFLCTLAPDDRTRFVGLIRDIILATDVTTTVPRTKEFGALVGEGGTPSTYQVVEMIIKAADISNPTRPLAVYERWVTGVMAEFFAQGDAEREKGLPISMLCDRDTVVLAKAQVGFISFLVGPLFMALHSYAPALQPLVDQLEANKKYYADSAPPA